MSPSPTSRTAPRVELDTPLIVFAGEPYRVAQLVVDREHGEATLRLRLVPPAPRPGRGVR